METHQKKRLEIMIEAPVAEKVTALLEEKGVLGYTVLPAIRGLGPDGAWTREGAVGLAGQSVMIVCILSPERKDALIDDLFQFLRRHIGFVAISDCEVIRSDRF